MRAVFDLDDTICVHRNRDYVNAIPIESTIEKIRKMKEDGWEIVIYSARGQVSCNGVLSEIERRNRGVVEAWLDKNAVPYDELVFGKPLGDLYVDDKGMSLVDFLEQPFGILQGGSGKKVYRYGNLVRKELGSAEETAEFKQWIESNRGEFLFPAVRSYVYNTVYMDFVEGLHGCDIDATFTPDLVSQIMRCKQTSPQKFDITKHLGRLYANKSGNAEADRLLERVADFLEKSKERLSHEGSFCHGDMTLSNLIINKDGIYTVDARNTAGANSYLLDLAKLRMSLKGYEKLFGISDVDNSRWVAFVDQEANKAGLLKEVVALEVMFIFRCYRYKNSKERHKVLEFAIQEGAAWL